MTRSRQKAAAADADLLPPRLPPAPTHLFLFPFAASFLRVFRGLGGGFPLALLLFLLLLFQFLHELRDEVRAVQVILGLPRVVLAASVSFQKSYYHYYLFFFTDQESSDTITKTYGLFALN